MKSTSTLTTRFEEKLPKGFAYPVQGDGLSRSLGGVAPFPELTVGFYRHPMYLPSPAMAELRARGRVPLLKASHICLRPDVSGLHPSLVAGWTNESWEISVYGVPVELLPPCHALLQGEGLPGLREWLGKPARVPAGPSRRSLELVLRQQDLSLLAEETP